MVDSELFKLNLEKVTDIVVDQMMAITGISGCSFSWWAKDGNCVETLVSKSTNGQIQNKKTVFDLDEYPNTLSVLKNGDPILINKDDTNGDPAEVALLLEKGFMTLLMLPMVIADDVVGLVELYAEHKKSFSGSELDAIKILSSQAAIVIQTMKQHWIIKQRLSKERALREAAIVLSKTLDRKIVLLLLAEQYVHLIDATSAYICSYDPKTSSSVVLAEFFGKEANEMERIPDNGLPYQFEGSSDFLTDNDFEQYSYDDLDLSEDEQAHLIKYGCQSVLIIPLSIFGNVNGYIELWESRRRRVFMQNEIDLCIAVSLQASIAIENSILYEEAQDEITHRKEIEKELEYNAFYDSLTSLPNRLLFIERLEQSVRRYKRNSEQTFVILFLDVDRLKIVNDSLGHAAGDELLKYVSKTLLRCVREIDTVSRFGGDEFLILIDGIDYKRMLEVVERIQNEISKPINIMGSEILISTSIGIIGSQKDQHSVEDLIKKADIAMYRAKTQGGGRFVIYDPSMGDIANRRLILETELRNAIRDQKLKIHYQPLVSLKSNDIIGFEALARWDSTDLGPIPPLEFIPLAEELGLIGELGLWILKVSCEQVFDWQNEFNPETPYSISINLSPKQLNDVYFVSNVKSIIQDVGIDPRNVVLEITESMLLDDSKLVTDNIYKLSHAGIKIHIDDFGTGYSSLSYLGRFPIDAIKIDREFILKFNQDPRMRSLVATIISMAQDFNMKIVAEGIEHLDTANQLGIMGCQFGQGYVYSEPKSHKEIRELINSQLKERSR